MHILYWETNIRITANFLSKQFKAQISAIDLYITGRKPSTYVLYLVKIHFKSKMLFQK